MMYFFGCVVGYLIVDGNYLFNNSKDKLSDTYKTEAINILEKDFI